MWYVYLLRCADATLYCGVTTDMERRVRGVFYSHLTLPASGLVEVFGGAGSLKKKQKRDKRLAGVHR